MSAKRQNQALCLDQEKYARNREVAMAPILSVIITAYNEGDYLFEAIHSVQQQTLADLEIILVDDGSTGPTKEIIDGMVEPGLFIIRQDNQGPAVARNVGIQATRGKYVGFLDGDDCWYPEKAASHIEILEQHSGVDLTYGWWRFVDEGGNDTARRGKPNKKPVELQDLIKQNFIGSASNVIARKEALFAAGLFDPNLRAAEDMEFWIRMARLREDNLHCIPKILFDYRVRKGQLSKNWQKMFQDSQKVFEKVRDLEPELVAAVEHEAYAVRKRYLAYLAYEASDYPASRKLLFEALRMKPDVLLERSAFFTIAAILCTYLPERIHSAMAKSVQDLRMKITDMRS